jgi:hypothetical protein
MADFAASAGMELFHVGKFGIFGTRTHPFRVCGDVDRRRERAGGMNGSETDHDAGRAGERASGQAGLPEPVSWL